MHHGERRVHFTESGEDQINTLATKGSMSRRKHSSSGTIQKAHSHLAVTDSSEKD